MSSNRSTVETGRANDREINELIFKLQALMRPELSCTNLKRMPASKVVKEVCNYIRKLSKEVDDLSDRLSELLASTGNNGLVDEDVLRNLLHHS